MMNKIKYFMKALKRNWKNKYRLLIQNMDTHQNRISILLSPKNIFVLLTTAIFILVVITVGLIAFTPLKVYLPGYTQPEDYEELTSLMETVDSLDRALAVNQQYIDNFYQVLHGQVEEEEKTVSALNEKIEQQQSSQYKETENRLSAKEQIYAEAGKIQEERLYQDNFRNSSSWWFAKRQETNQRMLFPPANGIVTGRFDPAHNRMGIVVENVAGTLVAAPLDGVIIFEGYDLQGGNTLIMQHENNIVSIYKHCGQFLKKVSQEVKTGEPIAKMGRGGSTGGSQLYFELRYNGIPVDPLDYMVLN